MIPLPPSSLQVTLIKNVTNPAILLTELKRKRSCPPPPSPSSHHSSPPTLLVFFWGCFSSPPLLGSRPLCLQRSRIRRHDV